MQSIQRKPAAYFAVSALLCNLAASSMSTDNMVKLATITATSVGVGLATTYGMHTYSDYARSEESEIRDFTESSLFSRFTTPCKFDTKMRSFNRVMLTSLFMSTLALGAGFLTQATFGMHNEASTPYALAISALCSLCLSASINHREISANGRTLKEINNLERRIDHCRSEIKRFTDIIASNKATAAATSSPGNGSHMNEQGTLNNHNLDHLTAQQTRIIAEMNGLELELAQLKQQPIERIA